MKNYILILFISLSFIAKTFSQEDSQLSLFTSSPLLINPATTGFFKNEKWRVWINHRDQWSSFLNRGLVTSSLSFDMPIPRKHIGLGFFVSNNSSIKGAMNDLTAMFSFGYGSKLSRRGGHYLSFGLQAGIKQKSFKPEKLSFDNQYIDGYGYDETLDNYESFDRTSIIYPDFNAGLLWFVDDRWKKNLPWFGFAAYHLISPDESFSNYESRLPRKLIAHGGTEIIVNRNFNIIPKILFTNQGSFSQFSGGVSCDFNNFKGKSVTTFSIGSFYRSSDAMTAMASFEFQSFTFIFNYDISVSKLSKVSNNIGGIDLTIRYIKAGGRQRNVKFM